MTRSQEVELESRARKESDRSMANFYAWREMKREAQAELVKLLESASSIPTGWSTNHTARVAEVTARLALLNAATEYQHT